MSTQQTAASFLFTKVKFKYRTFVYMFYQQQKHLKEKEIFSPESPDNYLLKTGVKI